MKKIGTTTTDSIIVEMTATEYKTLAKLPPDLTEKTDVLAADAVREAKEKKEITEYNYRTLARLFDDGGDFYGLRVSEMLAKIESAAPKYRLPEYRGLSPQVVKKLRDVLEKKKIA